METPICDFIKEYAKSGKLRLHMPGHKGLGATASLDITEIDGADVLYGEGSDADAEKGIIRRSEENASSLFGTGKTVYSAEGSSLAIRAMLYLCAVYAKEQGKRPVVAAGRNSHKVFMTAAALLDIEIEWLYGEAEGSGLLSCNISEEELEGCLRRQDVVAVYITSPDYLGNIADVESIARVCRRSGVLLLVDNAHGAYLNFLPQSRHPIALGADMCCDSAHKTLPVLTGGAYLHISKNAPSVLSGAAHTAMSVFASTSPSYLILQSLDAANRYIADGYREKLETFVGKVSCLKREAEELGYAFVGCEPLKLTISAKRYGYTGDELAQKLAAEGIICEFYDDDFTVMMLTPEIGDAGLEKLLRAFANIEKGKPRAWREPPTSPRLVRALSVRDALLSPSEVLPVGECADRVLAAASVACPPAVPIAVCGEVLSAEALECFKYYGIEYCRVVK